MADEHPTPVQITAAPKEDQLVEHEGKIFKTIREGKAYILVPPNARTSVDPQAKAKQKADDASQAQNVFYNPIQQFNRDLSVLAIKAYGEDACLRKERKHEQQRHKNNQKKGNKKRKRGEETGEGDVNAQVSMAVSDAAATENHHVGEPTAASSESQAISNNKRKRDEGDDEGSAKAHRSESASDAATQNHRNGESNTVSAGEQDAKVTDNGLAAETATQMDTRGPDENGVEVQTAQENEPTTANGTNGESQQENHAEPQQPWRPRFRILDALSATGLRALRYASEIPFATSIVANDRDKDAVKSINTHVAYNNLSAITATVGDALGHMYSVAFPPPHTHGPNHINGRYDVIDLDPYGTAAPFIDAALQALDDGGLLCVTCTDSGVFASCGYSEKTFALYGGLPIKGAHSHEGGLRLILHSIATCAAKYGLAIEPLLSLSIDFYARLFVRVRKSAADVKFLAGKTMLVYSCDYGCGAWSTQFLGRHTKLPQRNPGDPINWKYSIAQAPPADKHCEHCGSKTHIAGPMWGGPLHNPVFIEKILEDLESVDEEIYATKPRIEGMLNTALDELAVLSDGMDLHTPASAKIGTATQIISPVPPATLDHHPFFFIPSALCKVIKAQAPPEHLVKGAIRHAGYRATRSHCKAGSIKTDAPWSVIWEILREWVRQRAPVKEGAVKEGTAGWKIMRAARKVEAEVGAQTGAGAESAANGGVATTEEPASSDVVMAETNGAEAASAAAEPNGNENTDTDDKRITVVFDEKLGRDKDGRRLVRYQQNPRENWGPMTRAKGTG